MRRWKSPYKWLGHGCQRTKPARRDTATSTRRTSCCDGGLCVKVIDFGDCETDRATGGPSDRSYRRNNGGAATRLGFVFGTAHYCRRNRRAGQKKVDRDRDIGSLALVIY